MKSMIIIGLLAVLGLSSCAVYVPGPPRPRYHYYHGYYHHPHYYGHYRHW
ncbi:MAG: hypothetical protein JST70_04900 [Bacteroidetes bacterium]|nr:hypothetical protein [Bacteroidota bacterium]